MVVLSSSIILLNNSKVLDSIKNINDNAKMLSNNVFIMIYISMLLVVTALPAVMIALHCNPDNKLLFSIIAFLFSDLYLLQWAVKKFILKKENYCKL